MIEQYLNLESTDRAHTFFKITEERITEISSHLADAEIEILENLQDYTAHGTTEDPGDGLHVGKAFNRLLQIAQTPNEELAILAAFSISTDRIMTLIHDKRFEERVKALHPEAEVIKIKL